MGHLWPTGLGLLAILPADGMSFCTEGALTGSAVGVSFASCQAQAAAANGMYSAAAGHAWLLECHACAAMAPHWTLDSTAAHRTAMLPSCAVHPCRTGGHRHDRCPWQPPDGHRHCFKVQTQAPTILCCPTAACSATVRYRLDP